MALWSGLGQAANVAQLVGVDAAGLVSAILQAVRTARRNRRECRLLARRVMMVSDLLQLLHLQSSETTRRPEVARALDGLGGALRQAYELVESCQEGSAVYGFIMSGRQAEQFRDVQDEIDSYLLLFPVVSHIDITRRLDNIYNILLPQHQQDQLFPRCEGLAVDDLPLRSRIKARQTSFSPAVRTRARPVDLAIEAALEKERQKTQELLAERERLEEERTAKALEEAEARHDASNRALYELFVTMCEKTGQVTPPMSVITPAGTHNSRAISHDPSPVSTSANPDGSQPPQP